MKGFFAELRRRHVFRIAGIYGVVAWVLAQAATMAEEPLFLPGWFDTFVLILLLLGFPLALLLAWAFDLTPEGVKRTEPLPTTPTGSGALHFAPTPATPGTVASGEVAAATSTAPAGSLVERETSNAAPPIRLPLPARLVGASERSPFAFFGRDAELARLGETQQASVTERHLRVTLISGEPGIGKTTLVAQAARAMHATGANVVYGHCEEGLGVPYQPWMRGAVAAGRARRRGTAAASSSTPTDSRSPAWCRTSPGGSPSRCPRRAATRTPSGS